MNHARARTPIDARWQGRLPAAEAAALRHHLAECDDCRTVYDRTVALRRLAAGNQPHEPLPTESNLLFGEVLGQLPKRQQRPSAASWYSWRLAAGLAAAALVLLVVAPWQYLPEGTRLPDELMQERGAVRTLPGAGLGLSGVDHDGAEYEVVESNGICLQDFLRFYVNRRESSFRSYFVFGVDESGTAHWYAPLPAERYSYPLLEEFGKPVAVPYQIDLEQGHQVGSLVVVALFSSDPLAWRAVDELLPRHMGSLLADPREGAAALAADLGGGVLPAVQQTRIITCGGKR